jgi:hypothetical protein
VTAADDAAGADDADFEGWGHGAWGEETPRGGEGWRLRGFGVGLNLIKRGKASPHDPMIHISK